MNIAEAYNLLNLWIQESNGKSIDIKAENDFKFLLKKTFSEADILLFEQTKKTKLPTEYRNFLLKVGAVEIFAFEDYAGIEILSPFDIESFSKDVFDNAGENLYPELLLTSSIPRFGCFGGFLTEKNNNENFSIFYSDVPTDFWIIEAEFKSFDKWIIDMVKNKSFIEYL